MALSEENWVLCPAVDDVDDVDDDDVDDVDDVDVVDDDADDDVDEMREKKIVIPFCPNERHGESHKTLALRSQKRTFPGSTSVLAV